MSTADPTIHPNPQAVVPLGTSPAVQPHVSVIPPVLNATTTIDDTISAAQIRVVVLCALVTVIEGIDLTLIPLLGPKITLAWAISPAAFGIILSSGPIGLIAGGLGVGFLADRIGRRNALISAMVLMTASTLATTLAATVPQMLL